MILDRIADADRYLPLHPRFAAAFQFLRSPELVRLADGEHEIDGRRLYVSVESAQGRGRDGVTIEAHRRYIDIHVAMRGCDEIGYRPLAECRDVKLPYDDARDCGLFHDRPESWITLPAGCFAIFHPEDGHAPLATTGAVRKAVVKVLIDA